MGALTCFASWASPAGVACFGSPATSKSPGESRVGALATLAEASGNPLFPLVLEPFHQPLIATRLRTMGRFSSSFAYEHHGQILAAVRRQDPEQAAHWMRVHLEANVQQMEATGKAPETR